MGILMVLRDYASWTSMAGVPRIASASNWPLRIFWTAVWLAMFAIAIYQIWLIFSKFFAFPITVTTLLQMKPQEFPVVTICSSNPYKWGHVDSGDRSMADLRQLMADYNSMMSSRDYAVHPPDKFKINNVGTYYKKLERVQEAQVLLANNLWSGTRGQMAYTFSELIKDCTYNDVHCGESDFERILDPIYGACFAFNPNASRMTYRAGMKSGLRILADVQFETMLGKEYSFFPTTQTVGLRIRISGKNIDPAMESYGIPVATGAQTKIGLKLTEIKRMKRPYGICVEKHSKETFYPNHKYTLDVCMRSCSQRRIVETCGCAHPRYGIPMNARICGTEAQDCLLGLRENRSWNPLAECKCNPSCDEIQYYTTISLGRYHAGECSPDKVRVEFRTKAERNADDLKQASKKCHKYHQKNFALLNVFFDTLNSELLKEEAAYPALSVLIELGGQIMLWLGISIISVIEMIGLLLVVAMYAIKGRRLKTRPAEEELNRNN